MSNIAQFFIEGGVWMLPIAFLSVLVFAVAIERSYYLLRVYNTNAPDLMSQINRFVRLNQLDQAIKACDAKPSAAISRVVKEGLKQAKVNDSLVRVALEEVTLDVIPLVQKRSNTLAGLASLATLLGLLGTVMGLIEAFSVVADAPPDQKSALLTKAISVAMNCTAFGLIVAIPAMFFQLLLGGSSKKIIDDIDNCSLKLENWLAARSLEPKDASR